MDAKGAFDKLDTIDWKQSTYVEKGDIVYIYVGALMSAIRYKCEAMEIKLPEATIDDSEFVLDGSSYENYGRYMRLHLLDKYDNPLLGRSKLIENRTYSESWSYHIIGERLIAYKYGKTSEVQVQNIEKSLNTIIEQFEEMKKDLVFLLSENENQQN